MISILHSDVHFSERSHGNVIVGIPCCAEADHYADSAFFANDFGKLIGENTVLHSDNERILLKISENLFGKAGNSLELRCDDNNVKLFIFEILKRSVCIQSDVMLAFCSVEIKAVFINELFDFIGIAENRNVIACLLHKDGKRSADCTGTDEQSFFHIQNLRLILHAYPFGKAHEVFDFKLGSIVKNSFSAELSENLMLIRFNNFKADFCVSVNDGNKIHFKAAVA